MESCHRPTLSLGPLIRLTRQLVWFFSAATERDPEMMNCVGRGSLVRLWPDTGQDALCLGYIEATRPQVLWRGQQPLGGHLLCLLARHLGTSL